MRNIPDVIKLRNVSNTVVPSMVPTSPHAIDPDLARVTAAWAYLPEAIKVGILAMVQAAGGTDA